MIVTPQFLEPQIIYVLNESVPIEQAMQALQASGYEDEVSLEDIKPLGERGEGGYHAIIGPVRYLHQGAIRNGEKILGQFVKAHTHLSDEVSFVAYGAAHVWTWVQGVKNYQFYKQGDTMTIPAGIPHSVVAASWIGQDGIEQLGILMVRSSIPNRQEYPQGIPVLDLLEEAISRV